MTEIREIRGISQNFQNFAICAEIPEKGGSGPPPRPQLDPNRRGFWDLGSAPLPGARALGPGATGIRPRADGNPTPSRRKSCPDPDPLPPFKNTYLTHFPFGSDAARPPLTPTNTPPALAKVGQKAGRQSVFRSPGVGAVMFALLPTPWMAGASVTTTADTDTAPAGIPNPPRYGPDLAEILPRPHGFP